MSNVTLETIHLRVTRGSSSDTMTYLDLEPDFQREYRPWGVQMRTMYIETILLGRAMNPIWTIMNEEDESEEVLDGMHRLKTALDFIGNKFELNPAHLCDELSDYGKKKFSELDRTSRMHIMSYNFTFNKLGSEYRNDAQKRQRMYKILNRSSTPLNDYEYNKIPFKIMYDIVTKNKAPILSTNFIKKKDVGGNPDMIIMEILTFTYELPYSWTSMRKLSISWVEQTSKDEHVKEITERLESFPKFIKLMQSCIIDKTKNYKNKYVIYKIMLGRLIHHFHVYSPKVEEAIVKLKEKLIDVVQNENLAKSLGCSCRNARFQRALVIKIDSLLSSIPEP